MHGEYHSSSGEAYNIEVCNGTEENCALWIFLDISDDETDDDDDFPIIDDTHKYETQDIYRSETSYLEADRNSDYSKRTEISLFVYFTPEFKSFKGDSLDNVQSHILYDVMKANSIFKNSKIPLVVKLFCLKEIAVREDLTVGREYFEDLQRKGGGPVSATGERTIN